MIRNNVSSTLDELLQATGESVSRIQQNPTAALNRLLADALPPNRDYLDLGEIEAALELCENLPGIDYRTVGSVLLASGDIWTQSDLDRMFERSANYRSEQEQKNPGR